MAYFSATGTGGGSSKQIERMQDIIESSKSEWILSNYFISSGTSGTITVPDLSQYHWLLIYSYDYRTGNITSGNSNVHPRVFLMTYEEFKNNYTANNKMVVTQISPGSINFGGIYYISDTQLGEFNNNGATYTVFIKGIKNGSGSLQDIIDNAETILSTSKGQNTNTNVTVPDLSQYHWLILYNWDFKTQGSDSSQKANILVISYDDFKKYNIARYSLAMTQYWSPNAYVQAGMYYVNDTTVCLYRGGSGGTAPFVIKGIKSSKLI